MKHIPLALALLATVVLLPFGAQAQVYVSETFDNGDVVGSAPVDSNQRNVSNTAGSGVTFLVENTNTVIGPDQYLHVADTSTANGGSLEYSTPTAAVGNLYAGFQFLENNGASSTTATSVFTFGIGNFSTATGTTRLGSNANRSFGIELSSNGTAGQILLRGGSGGTTSLVTGAYVLSTVNLVQLYTNDNDTNAIMITRPDGTTSSLPANSAVVYLNGALIGTETSSGYSLNLTAGGFGNATGDATLGRFGFGTSTANIPNYFVDNLYVSDIASAPTTVPEPTTILGAMALVGIVGFRERKQGLRLARALLRCRVL